MKQNNAVYLNKNSLKHDSASVKFSYLSNIKSLLLYIFLLVVTAALGVVVFTQLFQNLYYLNLNQNIASSQEIKSQVVKPYKTVEKPMFINIAPNIENISVRAGKFENGSWELSDDDALFLESGGVLGENGNVVIYGHNSKKIFGNLKDIKKNQVIEIKGNLGDTYKYNIESIKVVSLNDVSILNQPTNLKQITVYTCTGLFDEKRLVIQGEQM